MKQFLSVVNSNRLNRYNMLFTIPALESGLAQSWDPGVPMHLSHDLQRLIGWSRALGVHLEPGLARLTTLCYMADTEDESAALSRGANAHWARRLAKNVEPHMPELERRLANQLCGKHRPFESDCAAILEPGLAVRAFPEIFAEQDKDGLIPLARLTQRAPGVFEQDGLLFFAHPFLRRSLSRFNALNTPFLSRFYSLKGSELNPRIRLDEDLVGLASTFHAHFELEYWWGPHFSDDLETIPIPTKTTWTTPTPTRSPPLGW